MIFRDRADAGRQLARKLQRWARRPDVVVLGLPRGGIPVASEVAAMLEARPSWGQVYVLHYTKLVLAHAAKAISP